MGSARAGHARPLRGGGGKRVFVGVVEGEGVLAGRVHGCGDEFSTTTKEERSPSPLLIYIIHFLWYILSSSS